MGKVTFALGLGAGYVLGARAGRARYDQIQQAATRLTGRPEVQEAVGKVRDSLPSTLQSTVDGLTKNTSGGSGPARGASSSTAPSNGAVAPGGPFPLEEDEEVVAQTYSALRERSATQPSTEDPGATAGPVVVNAAAEDEDPVAQTFSAFTERSADEPATEHTR